MGNARELGEMTSVGLREVRQHASELVRRVERGVEIEITAAIATTAHAHDARLYTRNPGDLAGLERLVDIVAV